MLYSNFLHKAIFFGFDLVSPYNRLLVPQELGWVSWKLLKNGKFILPYTFCAKFFLHWLDKFEICQTFTEIIIKNVASDIETCLLCSFKKGNSMYCMQMKKKFVCAPSDTCPGQPAEAGSTVWIAERHHTLAIVVFLFSIFQQWELSTPLTLRFLLLPTPTVGLGRACKQLIFRHMNLLQLTERGFSITS